MDLSPQLLRDVEFREQWRGYNPDEVDEFLERLATAVEELQGRLAETTERAERAERRVLDSASDDELRRTLVIAQRTADATLAEADAEAERRLADVDRRVKEADAAAEARARHELSELSVRRAALEADVRALGAYVDEQRIFLASRLREQVTWLEGKGHLQLPSPPELRGEAVAPEPPPPEAAPALEPTAAMDVAELREDEGQHDEDPVIALGTGREAPVDVREAPEGNGALAAAAADDPFLAELRRAVSDEAPLGPRELEGPDELDDIEMADSGGGRFRRRKRR
jgi:DivIVA domain-containing protein